MGRLQLLVLILGVAAVVRFCRQALLQPATTLLRPSKIMYNNDNATHFVAVSTDEPNIVGAATTATSLAVTPSPVPKQVKDFGEPSIVNEEEDTIPKCLQHTCDSAPPEECRVDPSLPQCHINCLEGNPVDTSGYGDEKTIVWPPLGTGRWIVNEPDCAARINTTSPCLLDRYQWSLDGFSALPTQSQQELCQFLHSQQVSYIRIVGDSLSRHLFQTVAMILSGNVRESFGMGDDCAGTALFSEKTCRILRQKFVFNVCPSDGTEEEKVDGTQRRMIRLEYAKHYYDTPEWTVDDAARTITIYGAGSHPGHKQGDPLASILNATSYMEHRWNESQLADWIINNGRSATAGTTLPVPGENYDYLQQQPLPQKHVLLWMPTHSKFKIIKSVEANTRALNFMMETAHFWRQRYHVPTINTFTMTEQVVQKLCAKCGGGMRCDYFIHGTGGAPPPRTLETYDGFHFGPQTNFWKAHLIFHRLQELLR
jgi:hypothetical protein